MRKIINSATTQYEPVLTEELVLDDRPISGSFNSITSDAVYKAISVDPGNVPPVESTDDGKVLTASYGAGGGSFEWAAAPNEVPAVGENDNAKVLTATYSEGTGSFAWSAAPKELPASLGTAGQVLTVNSGATGVEWATPSGGGSSKTTIGYATNDFSGSASEQYLVVGASSAMTLQPDTQLEITLDIVNKSNSYPGNVTFDINFFYYSNNNYYIWLGTYKQVATWSFAGLTQVTYHVMGSKQANYPFATADIYNMTNNIVVAIKCSNNSLAYTATATIKQIS